MRQVPNPQGNWQRVKLNSTCRLNFTCGSQILLPPARIKWQLRHQKLRLLCSITKMEQENLLVMYLLKMIAMQATFFLIFHLHTLVQGKRYVARLRTSSHCALKPVFNYKYSATLKIIQYMWVVRHFQNPAKYTSA